MSEQIIPGSVVNRKMVPPSWEYEIHDLQDYGEFEKEEFLNGKGKEGWELIHVSQSLRSHYLKRPISVI